MLKKLFANNKKRRDIRFLDAESYKHLQKTDVSQVFQQKNDEFIRVDKDQIDSGFEELESFDSSSFLDLIKQATIYNDSLEDNLSNHEVIEDADYQNSKIKSLGIFSDSKIYSALIQTVLNNFDVNIKHFNHPSTFRPEKYDFFDDVSSWIIFLSEDEDNQFLDNFLDRYVDKPTLFLFSKLNKDAFVKRISQFIQQNDLHRARAKQEI